MLDLVRERRSVLVLEQFRDGTERGGEVPGQLIDVGVGDQRVDRRVLEGLPDVLRQPL